ncbi:uncharacterized protein EV422DRAFT_246716 [Fimicolochytrium jonesii]|uniref:uncharacterized protein n=1 Tax=Fimicolochytrium jonesii TaxID=1396493 RepID=UPI0022FDED75|nr:uncharacterized protein EV422DRAFT_246716 [Fimicolochytrium jonesii]KAI8825122.1 hypothetical protein EV422DRAFT_246716 [Fimicolochytrium jonesii]
MRDHHMHKEKASQFWRSYLQELPILQEFPCLVSGVGEHPTVTVAMTSRTTSVKSSTVERFCHTTSITQQTVFFAIWAKLLSLYKGQLDVTFGTTLAGRASNLDNIENLLGPCVQMAVIRADASADDQTLLRTIQRASADVLENSFISLGEIGRSLERREDTKKLFDTFCVLQKYEEHVDAGCERFEVAETKDFVAHKVTIEIETKDGFVALRCRYNTGVLRPAHAASLLEEYEDLLMKLINGQQHTPAPTTLSTFPAQCVVLPLDDATTLPLPLGCAGELCVKTSLVGDNISDALFRTGNVVRMLPDGELLHLGVRNRDPSVSESPFASKPSGPAIEQSVESELMSLLAEFSRVSIADISRSTSIFQLGFDSLLAVQFSARLKKEMGIQLSMSDILACGSVEKMSERLMKRVDASVPITLGCDLILTFDRTYRKAILDHLGVPSASVSMIYPCTPMQETMLAATARGEQTYLNHWFFKIDPIVDVERLHKAWKEVVTATDALRTSFVQLGEILDGEVTDHSVAQVVWSEPEFRWESLSLTGKLDAVSMAADAKAELNSSVPPLYFKHITSEVGQYLMVTIHHALYDARSWQLIVTHVQRSIAGNDLPIYKQFSWAVPKILQRSAQNEEASRVFWERLFDGFEPTTFPDLSGTSVKSPGRHAVIRELTASDSAHIIQKCRDIGITLPVLGMAAWGLLLQAYTGQSEVAFGVVLSGRSDGLDTCTGPCINTLPFRMGKGASGTSNEVFLQSLLQAYTNLLEHQFTPLPKVNTLASASRPLCDTLFVFDKVEPTKEDDVIRVETVVAPTEASIAVEFLCGKDGLSIEIDYGTALCSESQAVILAGQFEETLLNLVKPNALTNEWHMSSPLLSIARRTQTSTVSLLEERLMHDYVSEHAEHRPTAIALEFAAQLIEGNHFNEKISYADLNNRANQIAHLIRSKGLELEDRIVVCLPRSPLFYATMLGVLKVGGVYVPIDPDMPSERKAYIARDTEAPLILTTLDLSGQFDQITDAQIIALDTPLVTAALKSLPGSNVGLQELRSSHLAYCAYTSGTTGKPSGVLVTHSNVFHALTAFREKITSLTPTSRFMQLASVTFDVSIFETFLPWSVGATVVTAPREAILADVTQAICILRVTHADLTSTVASYVKSKDVPQLQTLVTGGEKLSPEVLADWGPTGKLANAYGPTETTIGVSMLFPVTTSSKPINIGPPLPGVDVFVLSINENPTLVPRGGIGELCIGGPFVTRGYLNKELQTADKYISWLNPVERSGKAERLYRTGDLARLLPDDSLEYLGRTDQQVKINGQRVELAEIDAVILQAHFDLSASCSILFDDKIRNLKELVTFIVSGNTDNGETVALPLSEKFQTLSTDLRIFVRQRLPAYMVPRRFIFVNKLPVTSNGKLDVKLLENFCGSKQHREIGIDRQMSSLEKKIAAIVAAVMKIEPKTITASTTLLEVGIDSLKAMLVSSRLRRDGIELSVSVLLQDLSIADLAIFHEESEAKFELAGLISVGKAKLAAYQDRHYLAVAKSVNDPADIGELLPLLPMQAALIAQTSQSDAAVYLNHFVFELPPDTDFGALRAAWVEAGYRTPILRTGFVNDSAVVYKTTHFDFCSVEELHPDVSLGEAIQHWKAELRDCLKGGVPPIKVALIKESNVSKMILVIHHALYDGWSLRFLLADVQRLCRRESIRQRPPFAKFCEFFCGIDLSSALAYWTAELQDISPAFFPSIGGKRLVGPDHGTQRRSLLPVWMLNDFCKRHRVTPAALGQLVWGKLLGYYTRSHDVVFGNVVSGRNIPLDGIEDVIGPTFNTIPCRVRLPFGQSNNTVMQQLQKNNAMATPHQFCPIRDIQKALAGQTDGMALFNTLFVFQNGQTEKLAAEDHLWDEIQSLAAMDYSVSIEMEIDGDSLCLRVGARGDSMEEGYADTLLQQLDAILLDVVRAPQADVQKCHFPPELLSLANSPPTVYPTTDLLHSQFESYAAYTPNVAAVEWVLRENGAETVNLSFGDMNREANRVAHALLGMGATRRVIPVLMDKSLRMYSTVLGILKAGGAFTPIDPTLPQAIRMHMLQDSDGPIVCTNAKYLEELDSISGVALNMDDTKIFDGFPDTNPSGVPVTSSDRAYVLYTSGTTSLPKGVQIQHASVVQSIRSFCECIPFPENSRNLQLAGVSFDVAWCELFCAWFRGFTLVSGPKDVLLRNLPGTASALRITHLSMTPSIASMFKREWFPTLRVLILGGEMLTQAVLDEWAGRDDVLLFNAYGPSESTIGCVMHTRVQKSTKPSNIGFPLPTCSIFVVDEQLRFVPKGVVGELVVGGPQVGKGYANRPELTAEKFITLRLPQGDRVRAYLTGDLGRLLPDGCIEFLGRADEQIKLNGIRIELAGINTVLLAAHPAICDVVTIATRRQEHNKDQIVSFVTLDESSHQASSALVPLASSAPAVHQAMTAASLGLPHYMIPSHVFHIASLPTTPNHKVDKRELIRLYQSVDLDSGDTVEEAGEWTPLEKSIHQLVASVAKIAPDTLGKSTSFFRVGIDSLTAIQIASKALENGWDIPVSEIMRHPSVDRIARLIENQQIGEDISENKSEAFNVRARELAEKVKSMEVTPRAGIPKVYPCTPLQEGMLLETLKSSGRYINHMILRIESWIDMERFKHAWSMVIAKNDILRTSFSQTDSFVAFAQVVHDRFDCKWTHIEVAANEELDTAIRVQMERVTEKHKKLVGIPIAFALVESPEERRVVVSMHHALYDGFSLPLIFRDVIDAYEGRDPAIRPQFEHLVRYIDGLDGQISEKYWNLALQDCLPSIFPEDLSGEFVTRREKVEQTIECSISRQEVDDVCQQLGVAFQAVAQAAWGKILRAYIGNDDVVFGHVVSGRTVPMKNATNIIGPFLNTIPCRVTFDSSQTNGDVVRRVHANNIAVLPHQHTPLRSIQKWIENRAAGGRQLFDTLFVFQKHQGGHSEGSGWELMDGGKADVEYALSLEVEQQQDVYSFYAACPASIMSSDPLRILLQQLDEAIVYILRHPDSPCTLLTQVFNEKLLSVHNAGIGVSEYPGLEYMHRGVEFFARETPDHPALEFATFGDVIINERLSYAELNSHANWVAYSLIRSGVAPGSLVPICVEKSVWMYVAVLGVLKASCSFVSLDPDAPVDRKKFIINDVEASHVVVSRAQAQLWASECAVKVLVVDASSLSRLTQSTSNPDVRIPVSQSAYMIYTSGTSGTPKGVEISHENVAHALGSFRELLPVSRETRFLQFATIAFDVFVFECFLSWSAGATVVTSSKECLLADLPGAIRRLRATAADLTPTVAAMISRKDVPSLSLLVCGGEALTQHVLDEFSGQDGLMLVNAYGPTELTIGCTLLRPVTKSIRPNNIGQLFPTCSGYVLSEDGAIAVRGGIGELCVGGPQVAPNGYHNRPELTEERFTLAPITKEGIYKTGDYVKMLHDGSILFLGRRDDQHKLNGIRVELGEVTAWAKKSHDAIQDGITLLLRHPRQMRDQIVFFAACDVGKIGDAADADLLIRSDSAIVKTIVKDILRTAREKLPAYLVPSTVLLLKRVPRGRTEKADTKELSRLYCSLDLADIAVNSDGSTVDGDDVWTPTERIIQDAIISLTNLNADEVFRTVTIFSMGLDSIAAIMLSCKLKEANLDLTVADILQNPTIELMAIIQGKKQETKSGSLARRSWRDSSVARSLNDPSIRNQVAELLSIAPKDIAEVLPATPGQIFVMSAWLSSSKRSYVACFPFIILNKKEEPTRFCPDRFQRAWRALTFRHSILRTTFVSCPSDRGFSADFPLLQVILDKTLPAAWRNDKLAEVSLSAESVATLLEVETRQPLDLTSPPVVGRLVEYENGGCFFLTMHHALYDAWSLRVLREELAALYHTIDSSAPTPELNNASLDFVHYCAEQLFSGVTELDTRGVSHEEFWRESLKGSQTTIFPRSNPMLPAESTDGVRRTAILIENAVKNASMCEDACRKLGISLHSVFLAAWAKTSFRATNTANPIFGIFNSGRSAPIPGIQHFADPTFNVVPVAPKACDTTRLIDLAKQMHQDLNAMTPHIQLPLHKIQEWAGYGRERLFNTNVNFLKLPRRSENTAEALFEPVEAKPTSNLQRTMPIYSSCLDDLPTASLVKIDVDVEIVVRGDGTIAVGVFADSSYLTEEDGNRVIRELCEMVEYGLLAAQ